VRTRASRISTRPYAIIATTSVVPARKTIPASPW
jgi:hypothetical protein